MRSLIIGIVLIAGSTSMAIEKSDWKLGKNKQGVKVYTRQVENVPFKAFKGVVVIESSLDNLVALVNDVNEWPKWMANCHEATLLKRVNDREFYSHSLSKAPWPVKDRDTVIHHKLSHDPNTGAVTIELTSKPAYIPEKKSVARVQNMQGLWQFTPQGSGHVEVVYQALSDPGGDLPAWLVNSAIESQPYDTLIKLKKIIQRDKYQNASPPAL